MAQFLGAVFWRPIHRLLVEFGVASRHALGEFFLQYIFFVNQNVGQIGMFKHVFIIHE